MFPKIVRQNLSRIRQGARAVLHSGEVVAVKAGQWIDPATVAAVLMSPEAAVPLALGKLAKRRNPTGTGAHAVGEKGAWLLVKPEKREDVGGLLAWGPSGTLEDGEGRLYPYRWALVPFASILTSHTDAGRKTANYPQELQGRDRGGAASAAQVRALAAGLDPRRILLASSTPADSAPVVVYLPDRGAYAVASGNGRTMAARLAFAQESEAWEQYLSAVSARWNIAARLDELDRSARFLAVRVLGGKDGASLEQARALAGASQGTAAAELSDLEKAAHLGRSLGIETPLSLGGIDWEKPISQEEISDFASSNPKFWQGLTGKLDASKRAALKASPEASAKLVLSALLQGLPPGVLAQVYAPDGKPDLVEALLGMLPVYWSLQTDESAGRIRSGWALAPVLPLALDWYRRLGGKGVAAMRAALSEESAQRALNLEPSHNGPTMSDPLAYALGVAFVKASARTDPAAAMASYLSPYLEQARQDDPAAVSMFGDEEGPEPARVLLGAVDRRLLASPKMRANPPRGRVRHSRTGTEVVYPGGVRVQFARRLDEADALRAADAHYLETFEGQGSLFPGMGRESTIRNPAESAPWLRGPRAMWDGIEWAAESSGVSQVARSARGFFPAWRRAGFDPRRLSPEWIAARQGFAARHLAQYIRHPTEARALALMVWAVDVDQIDKRRKKIA